MKKVYVSNRILMYATTFYLVPLLIVPYLSKIDIKTLRIIELNENINSEL